ncbi:MAG: formyltetrahydrofolate deformylase [Acidobacteriota bacterium]|nr:formyltetrahydrofolate deformylase [Acidobacteriota bacterium]
MQETAVLLIDCPDRRGLIACVSGLLYDHGANILHADQHQDHDLGLFFMRVEWALTGGKPLDEGSGGSAVAGTPEGSEQADSNQEVFDLEKFRADFAPIAEELGMRWQLTSSGRKPRVALFCSQYLHCMADLLHRWRSEELRCEIPLIVSNHRAVENLAGFYGIPFIHIPVTAETRHEAEQEQRRLLAENQIDLVVLARYMQILSPEFVAEYPARIINVHHSFLPAFTGARPYHAAHARGVKLIGATSHYVTEALDEGPIIEQDVARVSHRDQVEDLVARGRDLERIVLSRAVRWHLDRRILCYGNKTVVFD